MNTLFIVDIQSKFRQSFDEDYLNDVISYLKNYNKKYDKIVLIMEENIANGDTIPSEIKEKISYYPIFKDYSSSYTMKNLKESRNFSIDKGYLEAKIEIPEGTFVLREKNGYILGYRKKNDITMDYINNELYNLLNSLRYDNITLIGGGLYNCVKKTQTLLKFLDINSNIKENLCYTIEEEEEYCPANRFDYYVENKN